MAAERGVHIGLVDTVCHGCDGRQGPHESILFVKRFYFAALLFHRAFPTQTLSQVLSRSAIVPTVVFSLSQRLVFVSCCRPRVITRTTALLL